MALTRKEKEFVKQVLTDTSSTNSEIVVKAGYKPKDKINAGLMYGQLMKKEKIQNALAAYTDLAETTIIQSIKDYKDSDRQWQRTLAVDTSKWLHDKVHGKAAQMNFNVNQDYTEFAQKQNEEYKL